MLSFLAAWDVLSFAMGKKYGVPNVPQVLTVPNVPNVPLFLIRQKYSLVGSLTTSDRSGHDPRNSRPICHHGAGVRFLHGAAAD
jgi:hypothetical protein